MSRIKLLRVIAAGGIAMAIFVQASTIQAACETCINANPQIRTVGPASSTVYYRSNVVSAPVVSGPVNYQAYRPTSYRVYRPYQVFRPGTYQVNSANGVDTVVVRRRFRPFNGFFANLFSRRRTNQPAYSAYYGSTVADGSPCGQRVQRVTNYVPEKRYRLQFVNVPITTLKPISSFDAYSGCERVTMKPVTEYVRLLRYVPYTTYRPVYKYVVNTPVCSTPCSTPACSAPACSTSVCATTPGISTNAIAPIGPAMKAPTLPQNKATYGDQKVLKAVPDPNQANDAKKIRLKTMPRLEIPNNQTAQNSSGLRLAVYRTPVQAKQLPVAKVRIEEGGWILVRKK